ncbi:MarR family winged helix-turn-helix transcriptional regulator [Leekyejoonella antrihumi]|uniref:MarR family transcriptional regulator n=1 Tax=Leekyejoonella antrihumi TaxID=1660198 RepID=A0A563E3A5_9MICO|nr:MarR family transcriptional regulator [Leekyejoonella antrihumi]TWP36789.1 MarR family transcriptional regulator [Leekyejoonella antrihumi]
MAAANDIDDLAGGLRTAVNRLSYHLRTPATEHGLTPSRLSVLVALDKRGPRRPSELASVIGITAASMSRLTEALVEGRWVERAPDPEDRRACHLILTEFGRTALDDLRTEGTSRLSQDLGTLSADDRAALSRALPILVTLADLRLEAAIEAKTRESVT